MKELQYPFDAEDILKNKKKIKRQLLKEIENYIVIEKKIAILGGYTTYNIKLMLELFLLNYGIKAEFYESEYNQYYQDVMFDNEKLIDFKPDIIYICTSNRNIEKYPTISNDIEDIECLLNTEYTKYLNIWTKIKKKYGCTIIQNNFEMPYYRLMGNKDASDIHGKINFLTRLNLKFYEYAQKNEGLYICDINYISADYGLRKWSDPYYYHMYKYAVAVPAIPYLAFNVSNIIKSLLGKNKKGFVLDLDNTMWGGVIGDDGADNILLGPEMPEGQAYSEFQRYIKEYKQLGVILNINSKNDYENAIKGVNHQYSEFKTEDFACIKANWNTKSSNFIEIADELKLLPESLVFVDDNPAERYIITSQLKNVEAPNIDNIENYIVIIDRNGYFETTSVSTEDLLRNDMYQQNIMRAKLEMEHNNYEDYLNSLEMNAVIKKITRENVSRIVQLINKSNQFNLTTKRYTDIEINDIINDERYVAICGKLIDRFGDNGIVSIVIGEVNAGICHIDLWLMSCRVLKRDMEYAMMDVFIDECKLRGVRQVKGYYYPTLKNGMVKEFYKLQGFKKVGEDMSGNTEWVYDIENESIKRNKYIKVVKGE